MITERDGRFYEEYKILRCPKCGWTPSISFWSVAKRYDKSRDLVKWFCPRCEYEGIESDFYEVKEADRTDEVLHKRAYAELEKRLSSEITNGSRLLHVTLDEFVTLHRESIANNMPQYYSDMVGMMYKNIPVKVNLEEAVRGEGGGDG